MLTLEERIADEIIEIDDADNYRPDSIVESYAENVANELMDDIGLNEDSSLAIIATAIANAIKNEIDWSKVDTDLAERHQDAMDWFDSFESAIRPR